MNSVLILSDQTQCVCVCVIKIYLRHEFSLDTV